MTLAKTGFGVDLSFNYLFLPNTFADTNPSGPTLTYGDGIPGAAGTFQEGLLRCLSPSGKQGVAANGRTNGHTLIMLSWLLYGQWWWRNFWSLPIDLSMGTSWFPGSRMDNSWTLLNYFTNRNLLWVEGTCYLL